MVAANLDLLLEQAQAERQKANWLAAQKLYEAAAAVSPSAPVVHHNLALCLFAQGRAGEAMEHSAMATRHAPGLVPAWVLQAKIERAEGRVEAAELSLRSALEAVPAHPQALLELAQLTLHDLCHARAVEPLVRPLLGDAQYRQDAELAILMAKLYDRDESDEAFTRQIIAFAERYLRIRNFRFTARRAPRRSAKKRIGLLSPLFSSSPVYYFTYGALALLAPRVELVFFSRGTRSDWATARLRALAAEWHNVAHLPAEGLANAIHGADVDALIDLGGWTDPVGLRALSTRPAPKLYKWVGGQSCTTGLSVFDGFLSDEVQTPPGSETLYREPLVLLEGGYVSYTPPDYFPKPRARPTRKPVYGVVCNPVKLSQAFLAELARIGDALAPKGATLRFVDRRYAQTRLRARVSAALAGGHWLADRIEFVAPKSHPEYLGELTQLDCVIDTFPYTGGLTTVESLIAGTRCATRPEGLFSARHSLSHIGSSGLVIKRWSEGGGDWVTCSPRRNPAPQLGEVLAHARLAKSLYRLLGV